MSRAALILVIIETHRDCALMCVYCRAPVAGIIVFSKL